MLRLSAALKGIENLSEAETKAEIRKHVLSDATEEFLSWARERIAPDSADVSDDIAEGNPYMELSRMIREGEPTKIQLTIDGKEETVDITGELRIEGLF